MKTGNELIVDMGTLLPKFVEVDLNNIREMSMFGLSMSSSVEVGSGNSRKHIVKPKVAAHTTAFVSLVGTLMLAALLWAYHKGNIATLSPIFQSYGPAASVGAITWFICLFFVSCLLDAGPCISTETSDENESAESQPVQTKSSNDVSVVIFNVVVLALVGIFAFGAWFRNEEKYCVGSLLVGSVLTFILSVIFASTGLSDCDKKVTGAELFMGSASTSGIAGIFGVFFIFMAYMVHDQHTRSITGVQKKTWALFAFTLLASIVSSAMATQNLQQEKEFNEPMALSAVSMFALIFLGPVVGFVLAKMNESNNMFQDKLKLSLGWSVLMALIAAILSFTQSIIIAQHN